MVHAKDINIAFLDMLIRFCMYFIKGLEESLLQYMRSIMCVQYNERIKKLETSLHLTPFELSFVLYLDVIMS